jgi:hypothetical protein
MNMRSQITLDPDLQKRAQARASELGISFAEYVRRTISRDLAEPQRRGDISAIFDLFKGGPETNIAFDKDRIVGEAVWEEHLRKTGRGVPQGPRSGS